MNVLPPKKQSCIAVNEHTSILSSIPRCSLKKKTTTTTSTTLKYGCSKIQRISQLLSSNSKIYLVKTLCWHFLERSRTQWHPSVLLLLLLMLLSRFISVRLCATPQTAAHQAPPSLGFSRQEHWSGLPFPPPICESEVAQSCLTLRDPMDCSLPGLRLIKNGHSKYS